MSEQKSAESLTWDLESVFPGGCGSEKFKKHREKVEHDLGRAEKLFGSLPATIDEENVTRWADMVELLQSLADNIDLVEAFSGCHASANVDDAEAITIMAQGDLFASRWRKLKAQLEAASLKQDESSWKLLCDKRRMQPIQFFLSELRRIAKSKMPIEQEELALDLAVDGLNAWNHLYDKMAGDIRVDFKEGNVTTTMSLGQVATKMANPDREVRKQAFEKMYEGWRPYSSAAAMALNAISGFRLSWHGHRGWESPLVEALQMARLQKKTLDTMWRVVHAKTPGLEGYIDAKMKLLDFKRFTWYDQVAPCGEADTTFSFKQAGDLVVKYARTFSKEMADFFRMALDKRWVEAEDRPGKRGGAFCTSLGPIKESRVFMTFAGTFDTLLTLAHELGHAYHHHVLGDTPTFASSYPMTLAETASIFAETLTLDAALSACKDPQEKIMLIDLRLQSAYGLMCDLQSRYRFETDLYKQRRKGVLDVDTLNKMMIKAQKKSYGKLLDKSGYHPLFWNTKLHFYLADIPFYNFPYTFGYLFAGGVYDRAQKEGKAFAKNYRDLLMESGSMPCEELAQKHLGVDLTSEEFWSDACDRALADVDDFVKLVDKL